MKTPTQILYLNAEGRAQGFAAHLVVQGRPFTFERVGAEFRFEVKDARELPFRSDDTGVRYEAVRKLVAVA